MTTPPRPRDAARRSRSAWKPQASGLLALTLLLATVASAAADEIKLSGFWLSNVTLREVVDGQLLYINDGGTETQIRLGQLQGIKLAQVPELAVAEELFTKKKYDRAVQSFAKVLADLKTPWQREWVQHRLVLAASQGDKSELAVRTFIELAGHTKQSIYLTNAPPPAAITKLDSAQCRALLALATKARGSATGDQATGTLDKLIQSLSFGIKPSPGATDPNSTPPTGVTPGATGPTSPPGNLKPVLAVPTALPRDAMLFDLQQGNWQSVIKAAGEALAGGSDSTAARLYELGEAQLQEGIKTRDKALIQTAGLSLMRVVVLFPKSEFTGAALMSAGLVHAQIGRTDLAMKLYDRALVEIDPQDAALLERCREYKKQLGGS